MMDRFTVHMESENSENGENLKNNMSKSIKINLYNNRP